MHLCSTDVPYTIFGHSMGAWLAYEMTKVSVISAPTAAACDQAYPLLHTHA